MADVNLPPPLPPRSPRRRSLEPVGLSSSGAEDSPSRRRISLTKVDTSAVPALTVTAADSPTSPRIKRKPVPTADELASPPPPPRVLDPPADITAPTSAPAFDDEGPRLPGYDALEPSSVPEAFGQPRTANAELEDEEVYRFLKHTSKQLDSIQISDESTTSHAIPLPSPSDFLSPVDPTKPDAPRQTDWLLFGLSYAVAQLDRNLPASMLSPETVEPFSLGRLRGATERAYAAIPPPLWEMLARNDPVDIYTWKDPHRTGKILAVYAFLWLFDLIPAFLVGSFVVALVDRRLRPPDATQLRAEAERRRRVGEEASAVGHDVAVAVSSAGALGMLARGTMQGVGAAAIDRPETLMSTAQEKAGHGKSNASTPPKKQQAQQPKGVYSLGWSAAHRLGPTVQLLLNDLGELGEKVKNLYMWRRPQACWRAVGILGFCTLFLALSPVYWTVKIVLFWLGFHFFFALWFSSIHPRFRRAVAPWWWVLYGVPTDAEWVMEVLQDRAKQGRPLRGQATTRLGGLGRLKKHGRNASTSSVNSVSSNASRSSDKGGEGRPGDANGADSPGWRKWRGKLLDGGETVMRRVKSSDSFRHFSSGTPSSPKRQSLDSSRRRSQPPTPDPPLANLAPSEPTASSAPSLPLIRSFAMLNGKAPGTLVVTTSGISFEPIRGFRTAAAASLVAPAGPAAGGAKEGQADEPGQAESPSSVALVTLAELVAVRKVKSFGLGVLGGDGLELSSRGKTVVRLSNVVNRDDVFNEILGAASSSKDGKWSLAPH